MKGTKLETVKKDNNAQGWIGTLYQAIIENPFKAIATLIAFVASWQFLKPKNAIQQQKTQQDPDENVKRLLKKLEDLLKKQTKDDKPDDGDNGDSSLPFSFESAPAAAALSAPRESLHNPDTNVDTPEKIGTITREEDTIKIELDGDEIIVTLNQLGDFLQDDSLVMILIADISIGESATLFSDGTHQVIDTSTNPGATFEGDDAPTTHTAVEEHDDEQGADGLRREPTTFVDGEEEHEEEEDVMHREPTAVVDGDGTTVAATVPDAHADEDEASREGNVDITTTATPAAQHEPTNLVGVGDFESTTLTATDPA